jgi:predicted TIM-barrel fold metal-dependent hydrolase
MNQRIHSRVVNLILLSVCLVCGSLTAAEQSQVKAAGSPDTLLQKDYKAQSIFKIPETQVLKAKYPVIDMHFHGPGGGDMDAHAVAVLKTMDEAGIQKTVVFSGSGKLFDKVAAGFGKYPERFELWCGLDLRDCDKPGFGPATIAELERCVKLGAKGVGEIGDKGWGLIEFRVPDANSFMHIDDPRMDPILEKLADLKLPFNFHSGDPRWMYGPIDAHNDMMPWATRFRLDKRKDLPSLDEMTAFFENALKKHPRTTFIACHLLNQTDDLDRLGKLFDKYPNLYADVSQREAHVAGIPRFAKQFMEKYADRLVYGTDAGNSVAMHRFRFRIWETLDEHFYAWDVSVTPWPLSGLGLSDVTLKKLYRENALRILKK